MVKQPGLFSPKFGGDAMAHFTQSPQNVALGPGIHGLAFGTGASPYHKFCIDGGTNPECFEYSLDISCGRLQKYSWHNIRSPGRI
jgi:hypothetical protein